MKNKKMLKRAMSMLLALCMILSALVIPSETGAKAYAADDGVGECRLVFGDKNLADEDAFIIMIFGDGFTSGEQDKFYSEAAKTAKALMAEDPFNEFEDVFKIYALGTSSNETGAKGDNSSSYYDAYYDTRDTYFGAHYWDYGIQRLLAVTDEGEARAVELCQEYKPETDFKLFLVNSEVYGGSGGVSAVTSLHSSSLNIAIHELGHSLGNLIDEYYNPSYQWEGVNLTQESDPDKVWWNRFVGMNGTDVYPWGNSGTGWYKSSLHCKMLALDDPFCEVCKELLRVSFCAYSNVPKLFFQTYADQFYEGQTKDMREYYTLRQGTNEISGDQLGDALELTYYDASGNKVEGIPSEAGTYTIKAEFAGNETFGACSLASKYTIDKAGISLTANSKEYDGKAENTKFSVQYEGKIKIEVSYSGSKTYGNQTRTFTSKMYSDTVTTKDDMYSVQEHIYDSTSDEYIKKDIYQSKVGAPSKPGDYEVIVTVYDAESREVLATQSRKFSIYEEANALVDNNDLDYWGATDFNTNKTVMIYGEGFSANEQAKFNKLAKQLVAKIRSMEPYKECQLHFNFTSVNTVSEESGIGTEAKNTFFRVTYDEDGNIVASDDSVAVATDLTEELNYYAENAVVIVNDKNVKKCASQFSYVTMANLQTLFITPNTNGIDYAANEILNFLTGQETGYRAKTKNEKAEQRQALITNLSDCGNYPIILTQAYQKTFTATGKPIDLSSYFHVYYYGSEIKDLPFEVTYYSDKNGKPYKKLSGAPSKPGKYHAKADLVVDVNYGCSWSEEAQSWLYMARGWTTFTIKAKSKK